MLILIEFSFQLMYLYLLFCLYLQISLWGLNLFTSELLLALFLVSGQKDDQQLGCKHPKEHGQRIDGGIAYGRSITGSQVVGIG